MIDSLLLNATEVDAYLERIGYEGQRHPNQATLRAIHLAHMLTVPFENLDIHRGRPLQLDPDQLFEKVVQRRRGGFCYELNGLFAALLHSLGFQVSLLSAKVARADGSYGPEFDHLVLLVTLEQPWLADVGFGDSFREPLRLTDPDKQTHAGGSYQLVQTERDWILRQDRVNGIQKALFRFSLTPHPLSDFLPMCEFHQTSPESMFTRHRLCSLATDTGRSTLTDRRLINTVNGERQERVLAGEEEYSKVLWQMFGIQLD